MNKGELINEIAKKTKSSKAEAQRALEAAFETIRGSLKKGQSVSVVGFGTFKVSKRSAREGRNPKTGETIKIAARKVPTFKAGSALKSAVN